MIKALMVLAVLAVLVGACNPAAKSMPSKYWLNHSGVVNASNYSLKPMGETAMQYSAFGSGYSSRMQGWASWGMACDKKTGLTLVAVWKLPLSELRCVRNNRWQTPTFTPIDYSGECK
jgi:hypothetical protein